MDRATGPPAEAIAVPHQALVHNHPRTPRTTGRLPALSQAEEIGAAPAHLRRDRARAELAESFGAGRASCRPQTTRTRPGPWSWTALPCRAGTGSTSRARTRAGTTGPGRASRTPAPRPETRTGARPGPRIDPRRESPSADRSPRQSPGHAATGRRGPHRTGHDNPRTETTKGANPWTGRNSTTRSSIRHGPGRTSNSPVISSARSMFRLVRISMTRSRWSSSSWLTASVCPGIRPPSARLRRRGRSGGPGHGLGAAQARREAP